MGHWYGKKDGKPVYEVPKAKGDGFRATTITDAKKLGLVPGVTTIIGQLDKPNLTNWKLNELLKVVITNPCPFGGDTVQWCKKVRTLLQQETGKYATLGHKVHDALEKYYKEGDEMPVELEKICSPVTEKLLEKFGAVTWVSEAYLDSKLGYGGKCDLHIGRDVIPEYPEGVILDFKTKHNNFNNVKPYPEQCQQLVAYRKGLGLPNAACFNIYIDVNGDELPVLHEWPEDECKSSWKKFLHLLGYWKRQNNFKG